MKYYDTVIFDMDGTILNTLEDLTDATNEALTHFGYPARTIDEVRRFVGNGVLRLMELAVPGGQTAADFQEVYQYFKTWYGGHSRIKTGPYPGIPELVSALGREGYKLAVVSNKFHDAVVDLTAFYFGEGIPVAIGENEAAGIRKKPAPDTVRAALARLGSEEAHAVYIGDSEVDYATALASGLDCISVSWGFRDRRLLETFDSVLIADRPEEILTYLRDHRRPSL